jgi:hypothetical protein
MKAHQIVPVAWLLTFALAAGCTGPNPAEGEDLAAAADMSSEADLSQPADLSGGGGGPDMKKLTCGELAVCVLTCRAAGMSNCETGCARNASTDAQTKFGALAICLFTACPAIGANAPCQMQSSMTCQMCVTKAIAPGGACRTQAQSCGL